MKERRLRVLWLLFSVLGTLQGQSSQRGGEEKASSEYAVNQIDM